MNLFTVRVVLTVSLATGFSKSFLGCGEPFVSADHQPTSIPQGHYDQTTFSGPDACARPCKVGEPPKTCYYKFTVEYYSTLTEACSLCRQNPASRVTADCQCIQADGYEKSGLITVNRMYPGPSIMVCLNDNLVIDVENKVPGNAITIHWHGAYQQNYQYADGVPFVTQCPIQEGSTFRYQWKSENSGTHLWHAHSGFHKGEGVMGPLIIREPKATEPNSGLWDHDNTDNVIFLTDWFHRSSADHFPGNSKRDPGQEPDNFLINGMGQWTDPITGKDSNASYAHFKVEAGRRYRFRLINGCDLTCPVQLTIEDHNLTIIASDGQPLEPFTVDSIFSFAAERYDFVLNTDKEPRNYWIQLRAFGPCEARKMQQFAILHYISSGVEPNRSTLSFDAGLPAGVVLNPLNVHCFGGGHANVRCLSNQTNAIAVPPEILKAKPDVKIYLNFGFNGYEPATVFQPGTYRRYHVAGGGGESVAMMGNISNVFPASPLLSQRSDVPDSQVCSIADMQSKCDRSLPCECVHIERIPLNSVVEIICIDEAQIPGLSHPFHLHGQPFYLYGEGDADLHNIQNISLDIVKDLDKQGTLNRIRTTGHAGNSGIESPDSPGNRATRPPAKDTFAVPNNGYSIIRFYAENPGYWVFHCHFEYHMLTGMLTTFHVGEPEDLPPVPKGFPKCGSYLPASIF